MVTDRKVRIKPAPARVRVVVMAIINLAFACSLISQENKPVYTGNNFEIISPGATPEEIIRKAAGISPSANQLEWQRNEFIGFFHFGINTFTDREWGDGSEDPELFNPSGLNARQWVRVTRNAGMKLVIITAKHHDGFCLWPSKYTSHSVASSPWKKGNGDVVGEVASACREYGLKFGFYLSPWDRHEASYGDSERYNEFFLNQLRELLTQYGEVSEVWFDGACAEGPDGRMQVYDWMSYYAMVRELQPGAVIAIRGPDVRWVGTESGYGRSTEWSVLPDVVKTPDPLEASMHHFSPDNAFIPVDRTAEDLGSREKLKGARTLAWYPAETDVSIRPGWFYHTSDDSLVKSPEQLVDIYFHSVGMNSVLLLNIPPDKRGRIHAADIRSLRGMKKILDETFRPNLLERAAVKSYNGLMEYTLPQAVTFDVALVQEDIRAGQRIERFHLEAFDGNAWKTFSTGTTVGYKRLLRFHTVTSQKIRFIPDESRSEPTILQVGLYKQP